MPGGKGGGKGGGEVVNGGPETALRAARSGSRAEPGANALHGPGKGLAHALFAQITGGGYLAHGHALRVVQDHHPSLFLGELAGQKVVETGVSAAVVACMARRRGDGIAWVTAQRPISGRWHWMGSL